MLDEVLTQLVRDFFDPVVTDRYVSVDELKWTVHRALMVVILVPCQRHQHL